MSELVEVKKNLPSENETVLTAFHHQTYGWIYSTAHWQWYEPEKAKIWHGGTTKPKYWMRFIKLEDKENK